MSTRIISTVLLLLIVLPIVHADLVAILAPEQPMTATPLAARAMVAPIAAERILERTGIALRDLPPEEIERLRAQGYTIFVPVEIEAHLGESIGQVGADRLHNAIYTDRIGGEGSVCILDSGVNYNHEALGNGGFPNTKVLGGTDIYNNDADPVDDNGHGSHVAGIAVGNGTLVGVAPDATMVAAKVLSSSGSGNLEYLAEGIRWCTDHADEFDITVISMSLGTRNEVFDASSCPTNASSQYASTEHAIRDAHAAGLAIVASAGNEGSSLGLTYPACNPLVFSVGNVGDGSGSTAMDAIAPSSNTHSTLDILAPGDRISSASHTDDDGYVGKVGTSMSAPHVAGAYLVLTDIADDYGEPFDRDNFSALLLDTGVPISGRGSTWPRLDVLAAVQTYNPIIGRDLTIATPPNAYCNENCTLPMTITNNDDPLGEENVTITTSDEVTLSYRDLTTGSFIVVGTGTLFDLPAFDLSEPRDLRANVSNPANETSILTITMTIRDVDFMNETELDTITQISPQDGTYSNGTFRFQVDSENTELHSCTLLIDDADEETKEATPGEVAEIERNLTGSHIWAVRCERNSASQAGSAWNFTIDEPPVIQEVSLNNTFFPPNATARIAVNATDDRNVTGVTADGTALAYNGSYWVSNIILDDESILVIASDSFGNTAEENYTNYTIDLTAPNITDMQPENDTFLPYGNVTLSWRATDDHANTVTCELTVDGEQNATLNGTDFSVDQNFTDGDHTWTVTCTDDVRNSATVTHGLTIDGTDPEISSVVVSDRFVQPGTEITVTVRAEDGYGIANVTADGTLLARSGEGFTGTVTVAETDFLTIIATDNSGRSTTNESERVFADAGAPTLLALTGNDQELTSGVIINSDTEQIRFMWEFQDKECDVTDTLAEGENATYAIDGRSITVTPIVIEPGQATFDVSGSVTERLGTYEKELLPQFDSIMPTAINTSGRDGTVTFCLNAPGDFYNQSSLTMGDTYATTTLLKETVAEEVLPGRHTLAIDAIDYAENTYSDELHFIANTTVNITELEGELSDMIGLAVMIYANGSRLSGLQRLDRDVTLVIADADPINLTFYGLDADWDAPWSVGDAPSDWFDDPIEASALLDLGDFLNPSDVHDVTVTFDPYEPIVEAIDAANETTRIGACGDRPCYVSTNESLIGQGSVVGYAVLRDITPPSVTERRPASATGTGTLTVSIELDTDEPASCRHAATNLSYENMTESFSGTTTHAISRSYTVSTTEIIYYACEDVSGNTMATGVHEFPVTITQPTQESSSGGGGGGGGGGYIPREWPSVDEVEEQAEEVAVVPEAPVLEETVEVLDGGQSLLDAYSALADEVPATVDPAPLITGSAVQDVAPNAILTTSIIFVVLIGGLLLLAYRIYK